MVNLKSVPYNLSDEDILWVKQTIASMSDEEKVGQLFYQLTSDQDEENLRELVEKYHLGGCRYNPMTAEQVRKQNYILQSNSKIPLFIACNPEKGGDGVCTDGQEVGAAIKIGATRKTEYAETMGKVSAEQMAAVGCNMAFAPVVDILYNHECEEVLMRSFGNDPDRVADMGVAYMRGIHQTEGIGATAKHFPGNGYDSRDAHLSNNVNPLGLDKWMSTYGKVYKRLIDNGLDGIMGGHILMPALLKELNPTLTDSEILPATLCKEIMTDLLRKRLGFEGVVVTDASHMVAMTSKMKRHDMLPLSIMAGCDMFLFFNDPDEDFNTMLNAYKRKVITEERMNEALTRILGLKAKLKLHKKKTSDFYNYSGNMTTILDNNVSDNDIYDISRDAITLVKNLDKDVLPLSPDKTPRITIVPIKGADSPITTFIAMAIGGDKTRKTSAEKLKDKLIKKGFQVSIYESPMEKLMDMANRGEKPSLNLYFAGKHAISDFVSKQDLIISLFDVINGRPSFAFSKGGGEIPWYVHELPVIGISVNKPTILADCPQLRTYINAYDSNEETLDALVDAIMTADFRGKDPIDSFCGMWDTRV